MRERYSEAGRVTNRGCQDPAAACRVVRSDAFERRRRLMRDLGRVPDRRAPAAGLDATLTVRGRGPAATTASGASTAAAVFGVNYFCRLASTISAGSGSSWIEINNNNIDPVGGVGGAERRPKRGGNQLPAYEIAA